MEKCLQLSNLKTQDNVDLLWTSQVCRPPSPLPGPLQPIIWAGSWTLLWTTSVKCKGSAPFPPGAACQHPSTEGSSRICPLSLSPLSPLFSPGHKSTVASPFPELDALTHSAPNNIRLSCLLRVSSVFILSVDHTPSFHGQAWVSCSCCFLPNCLDEPGAICWYLVLDRLSQAQWMESLEGCSQRSLQPCTDSDETWLLTCPSLTSMKWQDWISNGKSFQGFMYILSSPL